MVIINISGFLLIVLIVWWFWLYKRKVVMVSEDGVTITVENGTYQPSRIKMPAGKAVDLLFLRKDQTPCASTVLFSSLGISEELPLNKLKQVSLPPMEVGEHEFNCPMQMYRGSLIVE